MFTTIHPDWMDIIQNIYNKHNIHEALEKQKNDGALILPPQEYIFRAFSFFPCSNLKVVILGMDPYAQPGVANGLAFSTNTQKMPASLRNIFKELTSTDASAPMRTNLDLSDWAEQGILLLNTALTVEAKQSGSHIKLWRPFTTDLLTHISTIKKHLVFMFWGNHAHDFEKHINDNGHLILRHSHPSPLSRKPFVGCDHFNLCNEFLITMGQQPIKWV